MIVRNPRLAVRAERAGLFHVTELHLVSWAHMTVAKLRFYCSCLHFVSSIVLPPECGFVARRATSCLSYRLGRRIVVTTRPQARCVVPWKVKGKALLQAWRLSSGHSTLGNFSEDAEDDEDENVTVASLAEPLTAPPHHELFHGPGFDDLGGNDARAARTRITGSATTIPEVTRERPQEKIAPAAQFSASLWRCAGPQTRVSGHVRAAKQLCPG